MHKDKMGKKIGSFNCFISALVFLPAVASADLKCVNLRGNHFADISPLRCGQGHFIDASPSLAMLTCAQIIRMKAESD